MIGSRIHDDSRNCWCEPRLIEYAERMLVVHEDPAWIGQWGVFDDEDGEGDVVVAPTPWDKDQ